MSDHELHPSENPEPGWPAQGGTLPEESPTAGEAAEEKGDVEWEEVSGEPGEGHPAREHDEPQM
jgi:hypothetical protein